MEQNNKLSFGYNNGVPEGTDAAWGCRAIVTQQGDVDMVGLSHKGTS